MNAIQQRPAQAHRDAAPLSQIEWRDGEECVDAAIYDDGAEAIIEYCDLSFDFTGRASGTMYSRIVVTAVRGMTEDRARELAASMWRHISIQL